MHGQHWIVLSHGIFVFLPFPVFNCNANSDAKRVTKAWVADNSVKRTYCAGCSVISIISEFRRYIAYSVVLRLYTSGGEGCGKRWPDRCKRRKGEMRWYVPYMLSLSSLSALCKRFPGEAVECYTLDSWTNKIPSNIAPRCGERRLSQDFGSAISLCRQQQAWRGQPLSVHPKAHVNC